MQRNMNIQKKTPRGSILLTIKYKHITDKMSRYNIYYKYFKYRRSFQFQHQLDFCITEDEKKSTELNGLSHLIKTLNIKFYIQMKLIQSFISIAGLSVQMLKGTLLNKIPFKSNDTI